MNYLEKILKIKDVILLRLDVGTGWREGGRDPEPDRLRVRASIIAPTRSIPGRLAPPVAARRSRVRRGIREDFIIGPRVETPHNLRSELSGDGATKT